MGGSGRAAEAGVGRVGAELCKETALPRARGGGLRLLLLLLLLGVVIQADILKVRLLGRGRLALKEALVAERGPGEARRAAGRVEALAGRDGVGRDDGTLGADVLMRGRGVWCKCLSFPLAARGGGRGWQ